MVLLRSKLIRLAHQNPDIRSDLLPVIATEGKIAMITQPKASTSPIFEENVMAIPLNWGSAGTIHPANVAGYVADLWPRAKNGVAYILDNQDALRSLDLNRLAREVLLRCQDRVAEDAAMASERYEDLNLLDKVRYKKMMDPYWDRVKLVDSQLRVTITLYTSPNTGLKGLKVNFSLHYLKR